MKLWIGKLSDLSIWVSETKMAYSCGFFEKVNKNSPKILRIVIPEYDSELRNYVFCDLIPQKNTVYEIDL